jgi:hypothetical protein
MGGHRRAENFVPALDYAPLPDSVQQRELKLLDTIKY